MKNDPQIAKLMKEGILAPSPIGNTYVVNPQTGNSLNNLMAHFIKRTSTAETQNTTNDTSIVHEFTTNTILDSTTVMPKPSMMSKTSTEVIVGGQAAEAVAPITAQKSLAEPIVPAPTSNPIQISVQNLKGSSYTAPSQASVPKEKVVRRAEKKLVTLEMHTIPLAEAQSVETTISTVPGPAAVAVDTTPASSTTEETMMKEVTDLTNLPQLFGLLLKNQNTEGMNFERLLLMKTLVGLVRTMGMLQDFIVEARKTTTAAPTTTSTTTTTRPTTTTTTTTTAATTVPEPKTTSSTIIKTTTASDIPQSGSKKIPPPPPTEPAGNGGHTTLPTLPDIAADAQTEERWNKVMSFVHNYVAGMKNNIVCC